MPLRGCSILYRVVLGSATYVLFSETHTLTLSLVMERASVSISHDIILALRLTDCWFPRFKGGICRKYQLKP
jgi:hypothetical protein